MIALSVSDQGADADNRVVDELWKLVADGIADFIVRLADEIIRGCEARMVKILKRPQRWAVGQASRVPQLSEVSPALHGSA